MSWNWHPDVLLVLTGLEGGYLWLLARYRPTPTSEDSRLVRRVLLFSLGVLVLAIAEGPPLHDLSEQYLLSAHMLQHLLMQMVAVPLLLLGTPAWLLRPLLDLTRSVRPLRLLTRPLVAFCAFSLTLALWHVPELYDLALRQHPVHIVQHATFFVAAVLMWWPLLSPLPEAPPVSYPMQMLYLFIVSTVPAVIAAFLTFGDQVLYPTYSAAPRLLALTPLGDQQLAGLAMKSLGSVVLWLVLGIVFFRWYGRDQQEPGQDRPPLSAAPLAHNYGQRAVRDWEEELKDST
ncbi:MAG: cytochrome c oxidase assembly protein [Chloroflexi bacterium]|nr:cytochrome c oxidase assembly protein [Chloroflexota bacterium]